MNHIEDLLLTYELAEATDAERDAIEAHLPDCRACLSAFFRLKHHLEAAGAAEQPSAPTRARVRAAVAQRFAPAQAALRRKPVRWLLAGVGAAVAAAVVLWSGHHPKRTPPLGRSAEQGWIDTGANLDTPTLF